MLISWKTRVYKTSVLPILIEVFSKTVNTKKTTLEIKIRSKVAREIKSMHQSKEYRIQVKWSKKRERAAGLQKLPPHINVQPWFLTFTV